MNKSSLGKLGKSLAKVTLNVSAEGKTVFSIRENGVAFKTEKNSEYRLLRTLPVHVNMHEKQSFAQSFVDRVQGMNSIHI